MAQTKVVFAAPRDEAFPLPAREAILAARCAGSRRTYSGGAVVLTDLGIVHIPIPWDARTWATVAAGMASAGLASVAGHVAGLVLDQAGEAAADTAQKAMPDKRIARALADKHSWVVPAAGVIRVETIMKWSDRQLLIVGDIRPGVSATCVAHMESWAPQELAAIAEAAVQMRASAECVSALKIVARDLLVEAGRADLLATDDVALRVGDV